MAMVYKLALEAEKHGSDYAVTGSSLSLLRVSSSTMENSRQRHNFHGCAHTHPQHLTISLKDEYLILASNQQGQAALDTYKNDGALKSFLQILKVEDLIWKRPILYIKTALKNSSRF